MSCSYSGGRGNPNRVYIVNACVAYQGLAYLAPSRSFLYLVEIMNTLCCPLWIGTVPIRKYSDASVRPVEPGSVLR